MKKRAPLLKELTLEERTILLPMLMKVLKKRTNDHKHLTCERICAWFNLKKDEIGFKQTFNNQRLMKLTNYIRTQGLAPLISGSDGYYITSDKRIIKEMIISFKQRVESQLAAIKGLEDMLNDIEAEEKLDVIIEKDPFGITDWVGNTK